MIKEFNIGDRVHLVPKYHSTEYYTFGMMKEMPFPEYEAIIKEKKKVATEAPKRKIAKAFDLPAIRYTLEFIDGPKSGAGWSYSIEMFQEFYDLNNINPQTLEIVTTITTEDVSINKNILTKSTSNTESFTLNNKITIKF